MIRLERLKTGVLIAVLTICGPACFASCSSNEGNGKVSEIIERGTILFGTTGDYRPFQIFDLAIGGITITDTRRETMLMSDGSLRKLHEKYGLVYDE